MFVHSHFFCTFAKILKRQKMIQRIQSLFLLLAATCFTAACLLPIGDITNQFYYIYTPWNVHDATPENIIIMRTFYIGILQVILAALSFITIFLYKNRPLQSKFCIGAIVLNFVLIILMLWIYPDVVFPKNYILQDGTTAFKLVPSLMSVIPLAFLYLANKFINQDEDKVRAADRLR